MNKSVRDTMKRAGLNALSAILVVSALQLGNFPIPAAPAAAASTIVLASSDYAQNWSAYYSLAEYRSLLGPGSVNWPQRSEGCLPGTTSYKTLPWFADNNGVPGYSDPGNTFNTSGTCDNRYLDGGTSTYTTPGASPGAWAYPSALGGWASGASNAGFSQVTSRGFTNNFSCDGLYGGRAPMIWGSPGPDTADQASGPGGLFQQNNYPSYVSGGYGLYSNGTTFFRNTFTLPATYPILTNIKLYFQADDWMNVYLNGTPLFSTIATSTSQSGVIPLTSLYPPPATNLLSIQVADKAIWKTSDTGADRGSGLCYSMTADVLPPYRITPELTNAVAGPRPHLEPGLGPNCSFNAIATNYAGTQTGEFTMSVAKSGGGAMNYASLTDPLSGGPPGPSVSWGPLPSLSSTLNRTFCVQIDGSMPEFPTIQQVCFTNTIDPGNWDGTNLSPTSEDHWGSPRNPLTPACIDVFRTRFPAVQGFKGDIHAGGGLCKPETGVLNGPGTAGYVTGNPSADSLGEYVVSASAPPPIAISNFGSARVPGGNTLNLGVAGGYLRACRPDLLTAANTYRGTMLAWTPIAITGPVTTFNVTGKQGIYYFDGPGDLNILGTVGVVGGQSVTIVKTNAFGVVRVSGAITRSSANFAPNNVPSLGVISASDIVIRAAVLNVDAYLFTNGNIDTCEEGKPLFPPLPAATEGACATSLLTINGFLMAHSISFRRLGAHGVQGKITTEQVNLSPQIYLNPPKLFNFKIDGNFADGQGEKQPLF